MGSLELAKMATSWGLGGVPEINAAIADKWRPYRSLATSYLFTAADERANSPPAASPRSAHP